MLIKEKKDHDDMVEIFLSETSKWKASLKPKTTYKVEMTDVLGYYFDSPSKVFQSKDDVDSFVENNQKEKRDAIKTVCGLLVDGCDYQKYLRGVFFTEEALKDPRLVYENYENSYLCKIIYDGIDVSSIIDNIIKKGKIESVKKDGFVVVEIKENKWLKVVLDVMACPDKELYVDTYLNGYSVFYFDSEHIAKRFKFSFDVLTSGEDKDFVPDFLGEDEDYEFVMMPYNKPKCFGHEYTWRVGIYNEYGLINPIYFDDIEEPNLYLRSAFEKVSAKFFMAYIEIEKKKVKFGF